MSYTQLNISERLTFSGEALAIVQVDPVLSEALADIGYPAEELARGVILEQTARALRVDQEAEFVTRLEASKQAADIEKALRAFILSDRAMVRTALRSIPGRYSQLRMSRRLNKKRAMFMQQARNMYLEIQAHEDVLDALSTAGISRETILSRLEVVASFAEAMEQQQHQVAEAELATRKRREAMEALDEWMLDFLSAARYVFRKDRAQLKKIGLPIRRGVRPAEDPESDTPTDTE